MSSQHVLTERTFDVVRDGAAYKIKATALFIVRTAAPKEAGEYQIHFDIQSGSGFNFWQPDSRSSSRERAKQKAERLLSSDVAETHIDTHIRSWITLGAIRPVS
jgi:hypothetical protein